MLIYWNKRKFLRKKRVQFPEELSWETNMAARFNVAVVTSCKNALYLAFKRASLRSLACSRFQVVQSFSKSDAEKARGLGRGQAPRKQSFRESRLVKWCEKRVGAGERQITRALFALYLFSLPPYYTIWEPRTGYTEFGGVGEVFWLLCN